MTVSRETVGAARAWPGIATDAPTRPRNEVAKAPRTTSRRSMVVMEVPPCGRVDVPVGDVGPMLGGCAANPLRPAAKALRAPQRVVWEVRDPPAAGCAAGIPRRPS